MVESASSIWLAPVVVFSLSLLARGSQEGEDPPDPLAEVTRCCGRHSLYVLLGLGGRPVQYSELAQVVPVCERGTSMLQLRDCAAHFGLPCSIQRVDSRQLSHVSMPVIALLGDSPSAKTGHYRVVTACSDERVFTIDATVGTFEWFSLDGFRECWTGYILKPIPEATTLPKAIGRVLPWSTLAIIIAWLCILGRNWRLVVLSTAIVIIPASSVCAAIEGSPQTGPQADTVFRTSGRDAVNSLYVLLRAHGKEMTYESVQRSLATETASLADLRNIALSFGLDNEIVTCAPRLLHTLDGPLIGHLGTTADGGGEYVLLLPSREGGFGIINGAYAVFREMSLDEFTRLWSGYVLAPRASRCRWHHYVMLGLVTVAITPWVAYAGLAGLPLRLLVSGTRRRLPT